MGLAARWRGRDDVHLLIKTGPAALEDTRRRLLGTPAVAVPYLDRMDLAYAAADLVVCRAGSATVAELATTRVPAVLVPYPHRARRPPDPQRPGAVRRRSGLLLADADTTAEALAALAEPLLADPARLAAMSAAAPAGLRTPGRPISWPATSSNSQEHRGSCSTHECHVQLGRPHRSRHRSGGIHRLDAGRPAARGRRGRAGLRPLQAVRREGPSGPSARRPPRSAPRGRRP